MALAPDFEVSKAGEQFLIKCLSPTAKEWMVENIPTVRESLEEKGLDKKNSRLEVTIHKPDLGTFFEMVTDAGLSVDVKSATAAEIRDSVPALQQPAPKKNFEERKGPEVANLIPFSEENKIRLHGLGVKGSKKLMAKDLASELAKVARVLDESDLSNINPKLQAMVGDPDDYRSSTFAQFKPNPGNTQLPNPLSPIEGDEIFFAYMIPGAKFQAHDGSQWNILDYPWQGVVEIENVWYPRIHAQVGLNDIRRSIEQWVEPIQQFVPPPPPGVDYGALPVKIVDGPTNYGSPDELSGEVGFGNSGVSGGW